MFTGSPASLEENPELSTAILLTKSVVHSPKLAPKMGRISLEGSLVLKYGA